MVTPQLAARRRESRTVLILSLVIGILVGLVVVAFVLLTGRLSARLYPEGGAAWTRLVMPTVGALISGILLYNFFPDARGSGIPQTKFAIFINSGYLSLRTVVGKFVCCSVSLASGMALGREGPSVHIGAGLASVLARKFGLSQTAVKAMVPVGCSAALAAAFNTPIAAVLFSLEEILGDLHAPILGSVVIGSATSWIVLHLLLGDEPLFHVPAYQLVNPAEFGIYALLGVVGGLASVAFVKLLLFIRLSFMKLPKRSAWLQPVAGGLVVGALGLFFPDVLGVGYDFVDRVLGGNVAVRSVVLLAVLKIVATSMCYSSGNAGGIFGPSLFIGAMVGGAVGSVAHSVLPNVTANAGAYALVGMGTAFAGIIRTPLTSVFMIFELTRDYSIVVPLMISNLISFAISQKLQPKPIYEALAMQEGVFLPTSEEREELEGARVASVMQPASEALTPELTPEAAKDNLRAFGCVAWPVASGSTLVGLITTELLAESDGAQTTLREILADHPPPYVYADHTLSYALEQMGSFHVDALPVVSRANRSLLQGILTRPAVLAAFGIQS